jgi:high-affinity nickel permease
VSFEFLFEPFEHLDEALTSMLDGEPLVVVLALAVLLGLRHASDPDHLLAVTSLVAAGSTDVRGAARIGAWWGAGHAATMLVLGLPLILLSTQLPGWLETAAERLVGVVILLLAARLLVKWVRGGYRVDRHSHPPATVHRHVHAGEHAHAGTPRAARQAAAVGTLHGLAGTGAIVLLLIAALPNTEVAIAALIVFAPMSVISMAAMTAAFAWVFTRPLVDPLFRRVLMPLMGALGLLFGAWYTGIG